MPLSVPPSLRRWLESARDWGPTELGPPSEWPPDLLGAVAQCVPLGPVAILWGPRYLRFYGPDYAPVLGDRHPEALGMPVAEAWPADVWATVEPYLERVMSTGDVVRADLDVVVDRSGFAERVHTQVSYAPVRSHSTGEVLGIAVTARDRTAEVLAGQRADALARLGVITVENRSPRSVAQRSSTAAMSASGDLTALAAILFPAPSRTGRRSRPRPVVTGSPKPWPDGFESLVGRIHECLDVGCRQSAAGCRFATMDTPLPTSDDVAERGIGLWPDGRQAAAECRKLPGKDALDDVGRLVVALNPHTAQDDQQRSFLAKLTDLIARGVRDARAESVDRDTIVGLEVALETNRRIGAAMGVLMALRRVTPNEAFDLLRVASQTSNRKLHEVADDVLHTGTIP